MKPHVVDQATPLYADGRSPAAIGQRLGIDAGTVHKALKKPA
jgi:DNA-directed RNA polymerase specialized sigma24 family protein